jgi:holo-[acyl-carrier protein] synthase
MLETGIDIIEIKRIKKSIDSYSDKFLNKIFTNNEILYCNKKAKPEEHFAARFACKEAVMKLFGTGWAKGIKWTDLEVENNDNGKPYLKLHNKALKLKTKLNFSVISISLSHSENYAVAIAVGH